MDKLRQNKEIVAEVHHEVFLGYESGAIGLFKLWLSEGLVNPDDYKIEHLVLISPHRVITDLKTKHILSMLHIDSPSVEKELVPSNEFKLVVGFYANYLKTFDMMETSSANGYIFMDQKESAVTQTEKPGISCLSALRVKSKTLLAQGGFDWRVRVFSAKTLKPLVNLPFHKGIVNGIFVEETAN
mmetsp:Transcript_2641/g.4410  ORF Transcript_2641/g.4410 Transcript_2641/m.4410 type:complete len:185 (+) Transcript_2641:720-1274(+)